MKKLLIIIIGFLMGGILFIPKTNLFYLLQNQLKKENIYINSNTTSSIIKLSIHNAEIFINKINIAHFQKTELFFYILYNKIIISNLQLNVSNYLIKNANITYSILSPLNIYINGNANFGKIDGNIRLDSREIKIYIFNLKDHTLKRVLKKDKKGYYYYAKF
jgi:hypothetical protein